MITVLKQTDLHFPKLPSSSVTIATASIICCHTYDDNVASDKIRAFVQQDTPKLTRWTNRIRESVHRNLK